MGNQIKSLLPYYLCQTTRFFWEKNVWKSGTILCGGGIDWDTHKVCQLG